MAITGKFAADFASFYDACTKAEVSLRSFETGSAKVESSLNRMVDSFSGRKVIQDATLMAEAVNRIGGASKLTSTELARVGATATEAVAKMRALGVEIPPALQALATTTKAIPPGLQSITTAAGGTTTALGSFHTGLGAADRSLAAMGVNIGPQVRALDELSQASGKTASQIGLVGTAGLAMAAAMGGWQIGRAIADFFGLDQAIGNATAKLLGWGDVAGEMAKYKTEQLARASKEAGREITTLAEANDVFTKKSAAFSDSLNTAAHRVQTWGQEIAKVKADGKFEALRQDLASGNSTLQELSDHYKISTRALEFFSRETKVAADALKTQQKATDDATAAMTKFTAAQEAHLRGIADEMFGQVEIQRASDYIAAIGDVEKVTTLSAAAQAKLATMMTAGRDAMILQGNAAQGLTGTFEEWRLKATETGRDARIALALVTAEADRAATEAAELKAAYTSNFVIIGESAASAASRVKSELAGAAAAGQASAQAMSASWSQAMSQVAAGQGTMSGTVANAAPSSDARAKTQQAWNENRYYGPVLNGNRGNPRGSGPDFVALGYRALGGPVTAGMPYMVGERGPELFTPSASGSIAAHGSGGSTVVNHIYVNGTAEDVARQVVRVIERTLQTGKKWAA